MEPPPLDHQPLKDPLVPTTQGKPAKDSILDAIAAVKELGGKILQGIPDGIFPDGQQILISAAEPPALSQQYNAHLVEGQVLEQGACNRHGVSANPVKRNLLAEHSSQKAISFFKSRRELGAVPFSLTPNAIHDEDGSIFMSDRELKACIVKQALITAFLTVLTVALCIMAVVILLGHLTWTSSVVEGAQYSHVGGSWAMRLYGWLGACLCLLGFFCLGECKRSWDCDCCHDEVEKTVGRAKEAEQKAQQAHGAKQQFMTYVFHNIRVPFNAIVLGLGYLRSKADKSVSSEITENADLIQMMLDCAETMTSVLDDVTDMGQWEDGVMELHLEEFDLSGLVKFLLWGLKDLLYQKQMRFSMSIDPATEAVLSANHVLGDKHRVLQTLGNLLSNAIKFSPSGGKLELTIKCEEVYQSDASGPCSSKVPHPLQSDQAQDASLCPGLRVEGLRKPIRDLPRPTLIQASCGQSSIAKVLITVKDTGNGISPQDQEKLFEPYSFVSSGWLQMAGVSGLGLSIAKRFAEHAGGYIGVKSKEGEGSMFYFCLPYPLIPIAYSVESKDEWLDAFILEETQQSQSLSVFGRRDRVAEKDARRVSSSPPLDKGGRKVLLVEDTEINRIILRKVLQNLKLNCEEAENGQVAVEFLKQGRTYDLILMDKEMPVMDGHEATRQIRLLGVKTPIVALTGNALQSDRKLFLEAGVDEFQTKPLSRDKLVQLLARFGVEIPCA